MEIHTDALDVTVGAVTSDLGSHGRRVGVVFMVMIITSVSQVCNQISEKSQLGSALLSLLILVN